MKIIKPSFLIKDEINGHEILKKIEAAGRVCYKSEEKIAIDSAEKFIHNIIKKGHESVLEHEKITVLIICDRGISHEIVRHRIASYSQESTRYCNYTDEKFGSELTFILPCFCENNEKLLNIWKNQMKNIEETYFEMLKQKASPQEARSILPNSLKTEIVVTMNIREWRHFFNLRTTAKAHPQMREISIPLLNRFKEFMPVFFDDIIPA
jgi:thymidylate synthase (FAD)